jgi:predicted component of type VI protein secretion system
VDDPVSARRCSWIDAEDFHGKRLWSLSDSPAPPSRVTQVAGNIWLTLPDGTEYELTGPVQIGRSRENHVVVQSAAVSRRHAAVVEREGRWYVEYRGSYNGTFLNGTRVNPGTPLPLRHADRIEIGGEALLFSWPAQLRDPESTGPMDEIAASDPTQLSSFQRQVVQCLCEPWLAGASLESLPSNEEIAAKLGTPGATGTVKAALRRIYAKAGLSDQPSHAKRRALCRVARQRGWV